MVLGRRLRFHTLQVFYRLTARVCIVETVGSRSQYQSQSQSYWQAYWRNLQSARHSEACRTVLELSRVVAAVAWEWMGGRAGVQWRKSWRSSGEDGGDVRAQQYETGVWGWCGVLCAWFERGWWHNQRRTHGVALAGRLGYFSTPVAWAWASFRLPTNLLVSLAR
jgi:hypothetical protein